jgi:Na+-transporting methylmalonyl-CoA/oxaloacetate decarboxylase gamma subunit
MAVNNKISKKGTFGTTMGVTSIIAILVILVLIVFSALSITTSKADYTLAEKTAAATTDFYKADNEAETKLAEVAAAAGGGGAWQDALTAKGYQVDSGKDPKDGSIHSMVSYDVVIDENKSLFVELNVYESGNIDRVLWQVRSTSDWEPDNGLAVIQ